MNKQILFAIFTRAKRAGWQLPQGLLVLAASALAASLTGLPVLAQNIDNLDSQLQVPGRPPNYEALRREGDQLIAQGNAAEQRGDYLKAIDLWRQAIVVFDRADDWRGLGLAHDYIGLTYARLERWDEAEFALRRRLAIARDRGDRQGEVFGLNNLGTVLLRYDDTSGATASFQEALAIARALESIEGQGLSLSNLGLAATQRGDYDLAIKRLSEALVFRRRAPDPVAQANTLNLLGAAYQADGQPDEAIPEYRLARWYAREGRDLAGQFRANRGLTTAYAERQNWPLVFNTLEEWLELASESNQPRQSLQALTLSSRYLTRLGDWQQASQVYQQAIILARQLRDSQAEAVLANELSQLVYGYPFGVPQPLQ
ncbi:MAG: tetratricopeptide repeat protein [Spirulinaceae cyanobacterium SM2_1_0]|nr:tetratricopeptide repeat protein [Spirulinaceae cyanobacterium SM2_1_0]